MASYPFPKNELDILKEFYDSTNGVDWIWFTNYDQNGIPWNFTNLNNQMNPCYDKWQGVTCNSHCDTSPCFIIGIDLYEHALMGPFPIALTKLTFLKELNLFTNYLSGPLPLELLNLPNILNINLNSNSFSGTIPPEYGNFSV
jgi:hypothetical protein